MQPLLRRPWLPTVVNLAALALLASGLAKWTWQAFVPAVPQVISTASAMPAPASGNVAFNLQALQAAQLFGTSAYAGGANLDQIPVSSLNLVLTGLVATGRESFALIRVEGQPESPFAVGQEVVSGAMLQAVYPDRAIILRGGMPESLLLEGAPSPSINSPAPAAPVRPSAMPQPPTPLSAVIQEQAPNQFVVQRSFLEAQLRSPQQMLTQAVMVPHNNGGFLIREMKPGSVYDHLGLRVGDIIRRVNGQELVSMEDVMKAYQQLGGQSRLKLQVVRQGQMENLQYTVQ